MNNGSFNHNAQDICHKAIVIQTEIKNQCNAVVGIKVIYLVIFKKYIINIKNHEIIAITGKSETHNSQWDKVNQNSIEDKAQATQKIL